MKSTVPLVCLMVTALAVPGSAQSSASPDPEILALARKIETLERALAEVKAELAQRPGAVAIIPAAYPVPAPAPVAEAAVTDPIPGFGVPAENDSHTIGPVQFHGYSDFTYGRAPFEKLPEGSLTHSTNGFSVGDFDLFTTARMGNHFSMLGELLITSDFSNSVEAEMDRLMLTYTANDYLKISAGKYNTAIGFYTNEFHRARFFQTATSKPLMFADEDNGGILPVHSIGVTATGKIPSGELGLHWIAEVANGRGSSGGPTGQNFVDENNGKGLNLAIYARPSWWNGFQTGVSMYRDRLHPASFVPVDQRIYTTYAALIRPHLELITEGTLLQHKSTDHDQFNSVSTYAEASYLFGRVRPYFRYEYQNVPNSDPIFIAFGRKNGPSVGARFEWSDFVNFKLQFGRLGVRSGATANDVQAQLAFAF